MTRQHLISALLTALVVAGIAYAGQLTGLGGTYWSRSMAVTSTSGCVTDVTDAIVTSTATIFIIIITFSHKAAAAQYL